MTPPPWLRSFGRNRLRVGIDVPQVQADVAELALRLSSVDSELAAAAADLRRRYYHRRTRPVSLADCCAAAHALDRESQLATSDADLLQLVHDEGGRALALPTSFGDRYVTVQSGQGG